MRTRRTRLSSTPKKRGKRTQSRRTAISRPAFNWFEDVDNFHRYTDGLERQMTKGTKIGDVLQKAFVRWVKDRHPMEAAFMTASMAGIRTPAQIRLEMQALGGLEPDWPDINFAIPRRGYHGFYLEVKYGTSRPTPAQREKMQQLTEMGYYAVPGLNWTGVLREFGWYFEIPVNPTGDPWEEQKRN